MRIALGIASALMLAACQTAAPAPRPPSYHLVDLTAEYETFFDQSQNMAPAERVAAFKAHMAGVFPGFYDVSRMESVTPERYDGLIRDSFTEFPSIRARYDRSRAAFTGMLDPALVSFVQTFPDFHDIGDILLVHSVGEMDGGTRTVNGRNYMVFGADMIAKIYEPGSERAFFDHELFHLYHGQFFGDCDPIWCSLWQEGLATYVAESMNPGADDARLGLTMPAPIRPAVEANRDAALCAVKTRLNSTDHDDYVSLFYGNRHLDGLPARMAYYVGYLVVKEAARSHSIQEMAHMTSDQAHPVIEAALTTLAPNCPAN